MASRWQSRPPLEVALRKRREAIQSIELRQRAIATLQERVTALDAEIAKLGGPSRPRQPPVLPRVKAGATQRLMFELIRQRGSVTSAELAEAMKREFGNDARDRHGRSVLRHRALQVIWRCAGSGVLRRVGSNGRFTRWAFAR